MTAHRTAFDLRALVHEVATSSTATSPNELAGEVLERIPPRKRTDALRVALRGFVAEFVPQNRSQPAQTTSSHDYFYADLDRMNRTFQRLGAVVTTDDGFVYIDESKVPADLVSAYRSLARYGYANGLLLGGKA